MAHIGVLGAGVGGLASAIRLAQAGHEVEVFEKNEVAGGKLASEVVDGFSFDTGPSLLTMPHVFDDLGIRFERVRLEAPFRYEFADGSSFTTCDDFGATRNAFESFSAGAGAEYERCIERGHHIWDISERTFFAGAMSSPLDLLKRVKSPMDFLNIDAMRTLHQRARSTFTDVRLQQWLDRYATYSGSSPYLAPATLGCVPYLEQEFGCWHVPGGLATIASAMVTRAEQLGVRFHYKAAIAEVLTTSDRVSSVRIADGEPIPFDIVVSNIDAERFYGSILPTAAPLGRVQKAGRSTAGFAMLLGLNGTTPDLQHHNIYFSADYKQEFNEIAQNGYASDPTIYVCCSSVTDKSEAPAGKENWFVLVNIAAGAVTDWNIYSDMLIDRLGVRERIEVKRLLPPEYYARRYNSPGGAIYGTSSNGKRSAFLRANNRGPLKGLYLVGGSAHPGGGLPLVAKSAQIVSEMIAADKW